MAEKVSRRDILQAAGAAALVPGAAPSAAFAAEIPGPRHEGQNTPKICVEAGIGGLAAGNFTEAGMRRVKQLGVDYVHTGGGKIPWEEADVRDRMEKFK